MTSRALTGSEFDEIASPIDRFSSALWNAPASESDEVRAESVGDDGSCLRGTAIALGIEFAAAAFFYAAWHLWSTLS